MILAWVRSDAKVERDLLTLIADSPLSRVEAGELLGRIEAFFQGESGGNRAIYLDLSGGPVEYDLVSDDEAGHEACRRDPDWELVGEVTWQKGHRGEQV